MKNINMYKVGKWVWKSVRMKKKYAEKVSIYK